MKTAARVLACMFLVQLALAAEDESALIFDQGQAPALFTHVDETNPEFQTLVEEASAQCGNCSDLNLVQINYGLLYSLEYQELPQPVFFNPSEDFGLLAAWSTKNLALIVEKDRRLGDLGYQISVIVLLKMATAFTSVVTELESGRKLSM